MGGLSCGAVEPVSAAYAVRRVLSIACFPDACSGMPLFCLFM